MSGRHRDDPRASARVRCEPSCGERRAASLLLVHCEADLDLVASDYDLRLAAQVDVVGLGQIVERGGQRVGNAARSSSGILRLRRSLKMWAPPAAQRSWR